MFRLTMKKVRYFVPAILFYVLIFVLSSLHIDVSLPGHGLDKAAHIIEFTVLGFFLSLGAFNAFSFPAGVKAVLVFFTGLPLGLLDELHQRFVPGRTSALDDAAADAAGIIAGILIYLVLAKRRKRPPEDRAA
jgi:VanZ family protein